MNCWGVCVFWKVLEFELRPLSLLGTWAPAQVCSLNLMMNCTCQTFWSISVCQPGPVLGMEWTHKHQ